MNSLSYTAATYFYAVPTELVLLFGNLSYKYIVPNGTLNFQTGSKVFLSINFYDAFR